MQSYKTHSFWFSWRSLMAICLVAVGALAGCGSGMETTSTSDSGSGMIIGGVGIGGTGVIKSAAAVIRPDSGLIGAVVFLDKNGNRYPDSDEPSAVTDQDGRYTLTLDPVESAAYPLLIMAQEGKTIVKATGQLVGEGYVAELGELSAGQ